MRRMFQDNCYAITNLGVIMCKDINGEQLPPEDPIVCLSSGFTVVEMDKKERMQAVADAYYVTLSPHEWKWTDKQQARMAQYCLWAAQRLAAIKEISSGISLVHDQKTKQE